ncbi:hemocytin-like [Amphibalanus amphitrite]|uniref:hemocytin-like n=1 Tax=Amphibalanus amphitrite TaxID=1232801 RepID=UPI001C8FFE6B|nr:hemocytin-like [Amphibalanus amphitrite]
MAEYCHSLSQASSAPGGYSTGDASTAICSTVAAFATECERVTSRQLSWRSEEFCPLPCPAGQIFSACGVPAAGRCGASVSDSWLCEEGCACPEGLLMDGDQCVPAEQCSCRHNGVQYQAGDTVQQDCNTCVCTSGEWRCTELACPSQCVVAGDPHYLTFDGLRYDFQGKCSYYLVQSDRFSIQAENVPCSGAISEKLNYHPSTLPGEPSCTKSVRLEYEGVTVDLKQNLQVLINGETPPMIPWWVDGVYIKYASSLYISVTLPNGLEVWWDGETRAIVHAPAQLGDNIRGLCGNNNGNQRDDFETPEGDIEMSPIAFASKWKVDETCDDKTEPHGHPCEVYSEKYGEASRYCDNLISLPVFQKCHSVVDPAPYVKNCEYDLCSCRAELADCYCVHLADYADACAARGVELLWRAEVGLCGKGCPFGQEYQVCGDSCGHTCFDLATASECERRCVDGCQCPKDQALDADGRCAPISSCPCVYQNKEYRPGHRRYQGAGASLQQCECVNARWQCELSKTEKLTDNSGKCNATAHMLYVDCLPDHPVTCKSRHSSRAETSKSLYQVCESGCVCADGYVLDASSGQCVTADQCPCHHGGRAYAHGSTFGTECRSCTCESGMWTCEEQACDGVCTAWGNSHYETFDGRIYDIEGDCQYLLARGKETSKDQFEVVVTNVPCGAGSTCPKAVLVRVGHGTTQEEIALEADKPLPTAFELTRLSVRQAGAFAFVEAPNLGLVVQWDYGTRIYIRLSSQWKGKMQGLCGNFDGNPGNDFRGPSGLLENTAVQFAEQYKLQPYCPTTQPIVDSCKLHPERRLFAVRRCAALKSAVFGDCHTELDVEPFFERCVQDTCACTGGGDCECLCTAVAAYGQACSRKGVHVRWRSNDLCPMQCDTECSQYSPCVSACPPKTCENRYIYEDITGMCADDTCVEGCQPKPCPPGQVYHNGTLDSCVKENDCKTKCAVIGGRQLYEGDVITRDDCHVCYCTRGQQKCRGSPCPVVVTSEPPPTEEPPAAPSPTKLGTCREGWSTWVNRNKPMAYTRPRDVERIPTFIEPVDKADALQALVILVPGSSSIVSGNITFVQKSADQPLQIAGEVEGLTPGSHGFHIHETGSTADQCRAAGGHFNPLGLPHGSPDSAARHIGDLGNIVADSFGRAQVRISLPPGKIGLFGDQSVLGLALVVHAGEDDLGRGAPGSGTELTGNAGPRLACGVIRRAYDVSSGVGFCADNQVTDVRCRTAGTHLRPSETGERVRCSVSEGLVCDSDFVCQDYELQVLCDCSIQATEEPPPVSTTPAPTRPPSECADGWTEWMSGHTPSAGDWTDTEDARQLRESHSFCEDRFITAIECRTRLGQQDVEKTGAGAICNLNAGLVCSDALGYCPDFEVRFFCNCDHVKPPSVVPPVADEKCSPVGAMSPHLSDCHKFLQCGANGKQVEMSCSSDLMFHPGSGTCDWPAEVIAVRPECDEDHGRSISSTPPPGEHCDEIHPVRAHPTDCHAYFQCIRVATGELTEIMQSCGKHMMYNPKTMTCDSVANVRALREECAAAPPVVCPPNEVYDDCKIRCDQLCHYFDGFLEAQGFCKVKDACKPGCRLAGLGYRGCPAGYVWMDDERCVRTSECNCRLPNGKPLGPGQVQTAEDGCTQMQCVDNAVVYDSSGCQPTTPAPPPNCDLWGEWIDSTNPTVGDYEAEMLPWWESFCDEGYLKEIECQVADTGAPYDTTPDVGVTCNINSGLACNNKAQPDGRCHNYRIRYYCSCGVDPSITTPAPETTPTPTEATTPTYPTIVPPEECDVKRFVPLVYGEEPLPDSSFTASSSASPEAAPAYAKILGQFQDARRSWMPAEDNQRQYLQVDLGSPEPVYAVKVVGNPALKAAVVKFELWISDDGENFQPLTNQRGLPQGLKSISALADPQPVILPTPVTARYVRVVPKTWQTRIALKLEVFGCSKTTETPTPPTPTPTVIVTTVEPPPHCDEQQFISLLYGDDPLPDSSFSASSVVGPAMAAKYVKIKGSADDKVRSWTPSNNDQNQYLQVDLGAVQPVYAVTVMGNKAIASTVTEFEVLYSDDGTIYSYAVNQMGQRASLRAVEPLSSAPGRIILPVPFEGRYVRIHPTDWTTRITLKLELFGCSEATPTEISTTPTPPPRCLEEMGLENGLLDDSLITVSSELSPEHGASAVRPGGAGWIPKKSNNKQYIRVDLTDERTIDGLITTGVLVKGQPVPGYPGQFEPDETRSIGSYRVRYSQDGVNWIWVYNKSGRVKVFPGHSERTALSPMQNVFEQPLHARFVEIAPETWPEDGIGATVEVLGCYHPYPAVTTTTTTEAPDVPCQLCPGVPATAHEGCEECGPERYWNGTGCIAGTALCPCFYNGRAYEVGSLFDLSNCQECVCGLGGERTCDRKDCPLCGGNLVSELSESCDCQCNPCPDGTRICLTSRTCLEEEKWCDGVKQCPDDEGDECDETTTTTTTTTTTPAPLLPQYCTLKGNTFNTFDSVEFKYQICHHTLAKREGIFDVTVHRVCNSECHREVRVTSLGEEVTLVPNVGVQYGGFSYDLTQAKSVRSKLDAFDISVTPGGSILFNAPQVGFAVIVNNIGNVVVGLNNKHAGDVEGLCGDFDGNRYNDKHKPDGTLAVSTAEFGDSWALPGEQETCEPPEKCQHTQQAFSICQKIRQEPFSRCHMAVQPDSFISSCLETTCDCLDAGKDTDKCRCEALTTYVTECLSLDPAIELDSWRTKHQCPSDCPPGEVYRDCYRPTCEPSCNHLDPCDILPDMCFSGCYCPDGQVRSDGRCVEPVECDDCKCAVYPGGGFETFDKKEIIFKTNCSYQAAGRDEPNGKYNFKVLVDNANCHTTYDGRVSCTDDVRLEWASNVILLQRAGDLVEVFVNGAMVEGFYHEYGWGSVSQPPQSAVLVTVPALHLEVSLHPVSGELSIQLPSKIYGGSVGGVCGNCNGSPEDEESRSPAFWLLDHERPDQCVSEKPPCVPPPADQDPCQALLDETVFGACHQLQDPAPLVAACQRRLCDDVTHDVCDELEQYARRCYESGLCLPWRSDELCGREDACPPTTEYRQCTGTCLKSCDKQDCPRLEMDGCFCPDGQVYENDVCVSAARCQFCDDEGHRAGDTWKPDNCTSCECQEGGLARCTQADCPDSASLECGADEVVTELEGTGTECCPPRYVCRPAPTTTTTEPPVHCPDVVEPTCNAAEGKRVERLTVNGCPVAVCECVPEKECPERLQLRPLNAGESYRNRTDTCCPLEEIVCNKTACPAPPQCPDGFLLRTNPETVADCCPHTFCRQPPDTCLVRLDVDIDIRTITADSDEGFVLKRAGEVWTDGFCDNCTCREVPGGDPPYQPVCVRVACQLPSEADEQEYVYEENEDSADLCCPELERTACRDNGKVYQPGNSWQPSIGGRPVDPCVTWTCENDPKHGVIKVSNREKCAKECRLGHTYVAPAPGSDQCCGECERTACVVGGVVHAEGEIWKSEDGCTEFTCERDFFDGQLTVMSMAALCRDVSDCPPENLYTDETGCCQRCNRTDNCHVKVVPPPETVGMFKQGECVNTEPVVGIINCKGACDSMAFFDTDTSTIQSGCKCCGATGTRQLDVRLTCETGNSIYHTFTVPDSCACSKCVSSSSELDSRSAGAFWQQSTGEDWAQQTGLPDPWGAGDGGADPWATDGGGGADPWATDGGGGGADPWATGGDPWAAGGGGGDPWATGGGKDAEFARQLGPEGSDEVLDSELLSLLGSVTDDSEDIGTGTIH